MHQLFLRGGVLVCSDSARREVVIELAFLIAIDGRCGIELGRRCVLPRLSASKQWTRENDQGRRDERERNEPEQHDENHGWRRWLSYAAARAGGDELYRDDSRLQWRGGPRVPAAIGYDAQRGVHLEQCNAR